MNRIANPYGAYAEDGVPALAPTMMRPPSLRFLVSNPAHLVALGFGSGFAPRAPGTAGTLLGWLVFVLLAPYFSDWQWGLWLAVWALIGWWACSVTARDLGVADPSAIVWDEVLAFWLVLWLIAPAGFGPQAVAFVLFRLFDAVKRGPVGWADGLFKPRPGVAIGWAQGFGILFDDLVAAFCTLLVIALWRWI